MRRFVVVVERRHFDDDLLYEQEIEEYRGAGYRFFASRDSSIPELSFTVLHNDDEALMQEEEE